MPAAIGGRYILHETLGQGGLSTVFRATDRLTGGTVALKRVAMPAELALTDSPGRIEQADALRLMLAHDFETLASLRHPNIIGVLDYGFDDERQPYFTMEYLPRASNLLQAGAGRPANARVGLLIQVLQALAYLHRRGVVHRDLKPGNVLVVGSGLAAYGSAYSRDAVQAAGVVKVLDLGLSVAAGQVADLGGTVAYMAPEVLAKREPPSPAADLYAVGVMAYELFAGHHPFDLTDLARLVQGVLYNPPDLAALHVDDDLVQVIGRLLEKEAADRYPTAEACIAAFSQAIGQPPPVESAAIRESFIQAARFVGRQAVMSQLAAALCDAVAGRGSLWLVGGESGVGKTRLLDEVRTRALVSGVRVVRAQGVPRGAASHPFWREPLRVLALTTEVSDLEAGSLRALVPDIEALVGRQVPEVPEVGQAGRQRLLSTIGAVFQRQAVPLLLALEDMHWALNELDVLSYLQRALPDLPLLIVASYRDDEVPDLPARLPGANTIRLERLSDAEMAELSVSMLGEVGGRPEVLALLQRETEGNAFFLVEVVRALAQEAGHLSGIAGMRLPAQVFPSGIQTIVRRRLARVPAEAQSLLQLAAVAGRQVDLKVVAALAGGLPLEEWLTLCANAAVLETRDGRWRFAHDRLRDGLLGTLGDEEQLALHRRVALAIEQVYPDDDEHAASLAYHWRRVGAVQRERRFALRAGEHAAARFANSEALGHLDRALELTPVSDVPGRYAVLRARERVFSLLGDRDAQQRDLHSLALLLAGWQEGGPQMTGWRADLACRQAEYRLFVTDFRGAVQAAREAIDLARPAGDVQIEAVGHLTWGQALWRLAEFGGAQTHLECALALSRQAGSRQTEANSLRILGNVYYYQCDYGAATAYWEQALPISRAIGDRVAEASALSNLGEAARSQGEYQRARGYYEQRLSICREIGERYGEAIALLNLSLVAHNLGEHEVCRERAAQALRIAVETGNRSQQAYALAVLGHGLAGLGILGEAADIYRWSLQLRREIGEHHLATESLAGLALVSLAQGDVAGAQAAVEEIMAYLVANTLDGTEEPFRVYLACYKVLDAGGDPRAAQILAAAHERLRALAERIPDEALRRSFLEKVPYHRAIVSEFAGQVDRD